VLCHLRLILVMWTTSWLTQYFYRERFNHLLGDNTWQLLAK
jgi:hypothetical protein